MKKLWLGLLFALSTCAAPAFAYTPPQTATAPITLSTANVVACPTCLTTTTGVTTFSGGTTGLLPSSATSGAITLTGVEVGANGGTGVANTGKTITLGGNLTTSGAFASTFTMTGATNVTFPTSGTLSTTTGTVTAIGVTTANGVSGSSSGGATPNLTITLGAITPSSVASTGAVSGTAVSASTTLSALGISSFGSTAQASIDASGNLNTTGTLNEISTTANAVLTLQGHQQSGGGTFIKLRDDTLGNFGYLGDNSVIFGGTSYNELTLTNPQGSGTICIVSNGGGSSTANTGCDILDDASNNINIGKALKPPAARKGTFVCTGAGTITITNANYIATSDVTITMNTAGGTITTPPAMKTVTPATGFTVLCGATDTSTYNYTIWN